MYKSRYVEECFYYVKETLKPLKEEWYYFHNLDHTIEVFERVTYLWEKENLSNQEIERLQLGALFHDTGFIEDYDYHEYASSRIAEKYLKKLNYNWDTEKINNIILKTIPNTESDNILSDIIKDADLDNLWRDDFFEKWEDLRKEIKEIKGIEVSDLQWYTNSYKFIKNLNFYSNSQIQERQQKLLENKEELYNYIKKLNQ